MNSSTCKIQKRDIRLSVIRVFTYGGSKITISRDSTTHFHPLAITDFPLAFDDIKCLGCQARNGIDIRAAESILMNVSEGQHTLEFSYDPRLFQHFSLHSDRYVLSGLDVTPRQFPMRADAVFLFDNKNLIGLVVQNDSAHAQIRMGIGRYVAGLDGGKPTVEHSLLLLGVVKLEAPLGQLGYPVGLGQVHSEPNGSSLVFDPLV